MLCYICRGGRRHIALCREAPPPSPSPILNLSTPACAPRSAIAPPPPPPPPPLPLPPLPPPPPPDGISNHSDHLLVSSWDKTVRLYDADANVLKGEFMHAGAVLDCCFHDDSSRFSTGADHTVRRCNCCE